MPVTAFHGRLSLGKCVVRGASLWNPAEKQSGGQFSIRSKAGAHLQDCWVLLLGRLTLCGGTWGCRGTQSGSVMGTQGTERRARLEWRTQGTDTFSGSTKGRAVTRTGPRQTFECLAHDSQLIERVACVCSFRCAVRPPLGDGHKAGFAFESRSLLKR